MGHGRVCICWGVIASRNPDVWALSAPIWWGVFSVMPFSRDVVRCMWDLRHRGLHHAIFLSNCGHAVGAQIAQTGFWGSAWRCGEPGDSFDDSEVPDEVAGAVPILGVGSAAPIYLCS